MSLAHQSIRNVLRHRSHSSICAFSNKNLGFRRLHNLTFRTRPERKLDTSALARFDVKGSSYVDKFGRHSAALFILARNESTNTSGSEFLSTTSHESPGPASPTAATTTSDISETILSSESITAGAASSIENAVPAAEVTSSTSTDTLVFESMIPEPPAIPVEEIVGAIIGEPTLASQGLAGWSPSGMVQQALEFFHVTLGMPWWGAIITGTIIIRLCLFPLVIKSQRNAAKMQNHMPQLQTLQLKMTEARQTGNALLAAKYSQDMMLFMKEKQISPLKSLMVPLAMAPVFMSCFFGLRGMANLPVESFKTGGLFWFTDLTLVDPYYILPLVTSVTVWITLEVGADGMKLNTQQHGVLMKYFMRSLPIIMFPFSINFPGAILCYWVSTNVISLVQVSLLKIPQIRNALKIEPLKKFSADQLPMNQKKGFRANLKESWTNMKIAREIEDRQRYDEINFKRAGRGPIPKTYKYDPTKTDQMTAMQAKSRK